MLHFASDYEQGGLPEVLEALVRTNMEYSEGYEEDAHCAAAREKIRAAVGLPEAEVFFFSGGTQTNLIAINSLLRSYQGVIAAETGHIFTHETGSVEATGHKVLALPAREGKITAAQIRSFCASYWADEVRAHMVMPGAVYLSWPTEYGTIYSRQELEEIHAVCRGYNIPLFLDGARLAYGLASPLCDLTLPELAQRCDLFYIGGTKCGALFGEALVFTRPELAGHFDMHMKQRGALFAKGRLLGVQFETLFTDGLYERAGKNAMEKARLIAAGLEEKGVEFYTKPETNQLFPIVSDEKLAVLREQMTFSYWQPLPDGRHVIRLVTSWSTTEADALAAVALF